MGLAVLLVFPILSINTSFVWRASFQIEGNQQWECGFLSGQNTDLSCNGLDLDLEILPPSLADKQEELVSLF